MASAWGSSWGSAWGSSWGAGVDPAPTSTSSIGSSGGTGYRTNRKAKRWDRRELDEMVRKAFIAAGVVWHRPIRKTQRVKVRKLLIDQSNRANALHPDYEEMQAVINAQEAVNEAEREEEHDIEILLLTP